MITQLKRLVAVAALVGMSSACALSLRNPDIADLQRHPGRYQNHTVSVPFRMYKVDDGTGEVTVLSQGSRMPSKGEHVRVKGRVEDVAMFGGRALGLHIREEGLYVKR